MKGHGDHACLEKFRQKHPESLRSNATILLILQFILILLLFATAVLVCLVDTGGRLVFYLLLLGGLLPPLLAGLFCNTNGKYLTAAIITLKCTPCQVQNLLSGSSSATSCDILLPLCRC